MAKENAAKILEGKYLVFEFGANYTVDEYCENGGWALAVLQVKNGRLEERWHPCDHSTFNEIGEDENRKALEYLKRKRVRKVYTLNSIRGNPPYVFLGFTLANDKDSDWYCYSDLSNEFDWKTFFADAGIELRTFCTYKKSVRMVSGRSTRTRGL